MRGPQSLLYTPDLLKQKSEIRSVGQRETAPAAGDGICNWGLWGSEGGSGQLEEEEKSD